MDAPLPARTGWTFLTNHARVLAAIAQDPGTRVRDIALRCLLTERAVQRIIADLEDGGYLNHTRQGRSNHYQVTADKTLRHPADSGTVAELLALLSGHEPGYRAFEGAPGAADLRLEGDRGESVNGSARSGGAQLMGDGHQAGR